MGKGLPPLKDAEQLSKVYLIFVPAVEYPTPDLPPNVHVVEGKQVFSSQVQEP